MRRLARSLLVLMPALGLTLAVSQPAGASTHPSVSASARSLSLAREVLKHLLTSHITPNHRIFLRGPNPALVQVNSGNWAGYADDNSAGNKYDLVSGSWNQPAVMCPPAGMTAAGFFVGIDGFNSNTVEQAGTLAVCNGGMAMYFTWWEMFPNALVVVGNTVRAGDVINASVVLVAGQYTLAVTDQTTPANSFRTTQNCPPGAVCGDASAERIAEPPTGAAGQIPLANFGVWNLTNAAVKSGNNLGNIATFPDDVITMINARNQVLAQPGGLVNGNAFNVTWVQGS